MNANRILVKVSIFILELIAVACGFLVLSAFGSEEVIWKAVLLLIAILVLDIIAIFLIIDSAIILRYVYAAYGCILAMFYEKLGIHTRNTKIAHRLRLKYKTYSNLYSELSYRYYLGD